MFYCVTESKLQALAERTTKNIIAFTMDRANRNKSVIPGDTSLTYDYPSGLFPSTDDMQAIMQADKPKKALKKYIKKKINILYKPDLDDVDDRNFCLAVTTLMYMANKKNREIMVFVMPDEMNEADREYYKYLEMYVNAIFAEFYANKKAEDGKYPQMIFREFPPAWVSADKKERKRIIKYYDKCGFTLNKKNLKKKMKPKKIAKAIYRFALEFRMSHSGTVLYEMLRCTFNIDMRATSLMNSDLTDVKKEVRKALSTMLVKQLCGKMEESDENIAKMVSKNKKGAKKLLKKYKKRTKIMRKDQLGYYNELQALFNSDYGLNNAMGKEIAILPDIGKKTGKKEKKFVKVVKKLTKMDPAILSAIFVHIYSRSFGNDVGDSEYNRVMSAVLKRYKNDGASLAKTFASIAKKANRAMKDAAENKA